MDFKIWLKNEGKREQTIQVYARSVRQFMEWLHISHGQNWNPDEISAKVIHEWIHHMQTIEKVAKPTINKRIASLKVYWSYLIEQKIAIYDPTKKIKIKRISRLEDTPRWLNEIEHAKLLNLIRREENEWKRKRNMAMVRLMLQAGLRIGEVANLDLEDYRKIGSVGTITIREGKGGKLDVVKAVKDICRALDEWIEVRGQSIDSTALFLSTHQKKVTRQAIHKQVKPLLEQVSPKGGLTTHSLRHTYCKNLLEVSGGDLVLVAQMARHESIETTRRYVTPSAEEQWSILQKLSEER
ncbi:tyrosine-type recombinase/integrase [Bacillus mycoides]|uniref:tyrosine-type recombinase/integrase n=1 Tax=Bacillus mycoides TaxID=1405 RepID=UPI003D238326